MKTAARAWSVLLAIPVLAACSGRPSYWDSAPVSGVSYGLNRGVALVDDAGHRVVVLTAGDDQELTASSVPVGHRVVSAAASPDGERLLVLSAGDPEKLGATVEGPSLTVVGSDPSTFAIEQAHYTMPTALGNLAIDPLGRWAVAYAGGKSDAFVQNPNELVIFDLTAPTSTPQALSIRSFGGTPQRLTFTPPLMLPTGQRRLLIVETDIDVTLVDLDAPAPPLPQVTVRLTSGASAAQVTPAAVAVDGFDPTNPADARIALRAVGDRNVYTLTLGPSTDPSAEFTPTINLTDVGGVPSDIAFVRTDSGLRVAALVPSSSSAVLVDPDTSDTTTVQLATGYSNLSLVTSVTGSDTGADVAMLWNGSSSTQGSGVALWTLGMTVGQPYFSVEVLGVSSPIAAVDDVAAPHQTLKVLQTTAGDGFFVLDLATRQVSPLDTQSQSSVAIAPDGGRMWAFAPGGTDLAEIDWATLTPVPLATDAPIAAVYDVARPGSSGRSLIAIHALGTTEATVFDALHPDQATARLASSLLLEGP